MRANRIKNISKVVKMLVHLYSIILITGAGSGSGVGSFGF